MDEIVAQGSIFTFSAIISNSLNQDINKYMVTNDQQESYFYMVLYIMDVSFGGQHFLDMKWAWKK